MQKIDRGIGGEFPFCHQTRQDEPEAARRSSRGFAGASGRGIIMRAPLYPHPTKGPRATWHSHSSSSMKVRFVPGYCFRFRSILHRTHCRRFMLYCSRHPRPTDYLNFIILFFKIIYSFFSLLFSFLLNHQCRRKSIHIFLSAPLIHELSLLYFFSYHPKESF